MREGRKKEEEDSSVDREEGNRKRYKEEGKRRVLKVKRCIIGKMKA